jgi:hypothetical protein
VKCDAIGTRQRPDADGTRDHMLPNPKLDLIDKLEDKAQAPDLVKALCSFVKP